MYAVIETGGKQYRVELGSELVIERLDRAPGDSIDFDRVLLVADGDAAQIGTPVVGDALVTADVVRQDRGDKVVVFKYRPKARHRAKQGHRQEQTVIRVSDIRFNGRSAADEAGAREKEESKERRAAAAEAERKAAADRELAAKLEQEAAAQQAAAEPEATSVAKPKKGTAAAKTKTTTASEANPKPSAKKKAEPAKPTTKGAQPKAKAAKSTTDEATSGSAAKSAAKPKSPRTKTKKDE